MAEQPAWHSIVRRRACTLIALLLAIVALGATPAGIVLAVAPTVTSVSPNSGPTAGGTSVTITGTNLTGATSVTFGGASATNVVVTNSTTITAKTPAHAAGAVTVTVTTSGGTGSKTSAYTYVAPPTVTSVSPSSGTIAGGTSVTITGTVFTGATAVTFGGTNATTFSVTNSTTITATTPAHAAGAVTVAVTTVGGTGSKTSAYTYVGTLSITAAPANFSYSATLSGDPLTLSSSFAVSVNDSRGSGAGWNLQATIGVLTDAASDTIPAGNHTIQSVAVTGVTGTAPTNGIGYPLAIPTASGKIVNAALNTGTGQATMTFSTRLVVPADAAVGTYTATLTVTIASGP